MKHQDVRETVSEWTETLTGLARAHERAHFRRARPPAAPRDRRDRVAHEFAREIRQSKQIIRRRQRDVLSPHIIQQPKNTEEKRKRTGTPSGPAMVR
jgi:hypothetical protein